MNIESHVEEINNEGIIDWFLNLPEIISLTMISGVLIIILGICLRVEDKRHFEKKGEVRSLMTGTIDTVPAKSTYTPKTEPSHVDSVKQEKSLTSDTDNTSTIEEVSEKSSEENNNEYTDTNASVFSISTGEIQIVGYSYEDYKSKNDVMKKDSSFSISEGDGENTSSTE